MDVLQDRDPAVRSDRIREETMKKEEIRELFVKGIDCSQVVAGDVCRRDGNDRRRCKKSICVFWRRYDVWGNLRCGYRSSDGACGMKYGHCREEDMDQKNIMMQKTAEFKKNFQQKYPSCMCRELLGHDLGKPGELEKVMEEGLLLDFCPGVVEAAIESLEKVL